VIPVHVPSLKERREDVGLLVEHFNRKFNREKSRRVTGVTKAGLRALMAYDWPGNVRELENLMERMVILKSSGMIDVLDFPEKYRRLSLSEIEYEDLMNTSKAIVGSANQNLGASFVPAQVEQVGAKGNSQVLNYGANNGQKVVQQLSQEKTGEEGMKISGNSFIKGPIQQSASTSAQQMEQAANAVDTASVDQMSTEIDGTITVDQAIRLISDKMIFPNEGLDFNSVVDQFENILILRSLERTGWNRNRAAGLLRLNRTTLVEKLKKKQLLPPLRYGDQVVEGNA
jgi:DNA-binding NtrC family response regulator